MKQTITFLILLLCITRAYSQQSINPLIDQGSEVLLDRLPENDFFYTHTFQKGQTIYSLAKTFKTSVSEIYALNNLSAQTPIKLGQTVKVPFNVTSLYTEQSTKPQTSNKFIPVYYIVQAKETLYGIGKSYFGQDVATFAKRNKIDGTTISIGQKLLVGWLPIDGSDKAVKVNTTISKSESTKDVVREKFVTHIIEDTIEKSPNTSESDHNITKDIIGPKPLDTEALIANTTEESVDTLAIDIEEPEEESKPTLTTRRTRGIGIWERNSKVNSMAYVLHHTAKKGSMIELYNPQLNLRTKAKVLGRIPLGTYPSDVSVIMSKKVAESLGALDTRFMVDLTFVEDIQE